MGVVSELEDKQDIEDIDGLEHSGPASVSDSEPHCEICDASPSSSPVLRTRATLVLRTDERRPTDA